VLFGGKMPLIKIKANKLARKKVKRLGRGSSSGKGRTCGRGGKGQTARAGYNIPTGFEGGQMPLYRRLPKRGFKNPFKDEIQIINISNLNIFENNTEINKNLLLEKGLIKDLNKKVKLLGKGELKVSGLKVEIDFCSKKAKESIEKNNGKVKLVS